MKNFSLILIIASVYSIGFGQSAEHYYWFQSKKQPLQLLAEKTYLLLDRHISKDSLSAKLHLDKVKIDSIRKEEYSALHKQTNIEQRKNYWTVIKSRLEVLDLSRPEIIYHAPFFKVSNGGELGLTHLFMVKLNSQKDKKILETLARRHKVDVLYSNKHRPLWYTLACNRNSTGNALQMANLFYETGLFSAAEPSFLQPVIFNSINDPYYGAQWNLKNTGQYGGVAGEDIQVEDAWKISKSHSGVVTSINDDGVDLTHPDLPNIHSFSFDAYTGTSPSQIHGPHGTAVAGIAGANTGNNIGVSGVAPQGTIMSVSQSHFDVSWDKFADGIEESWQNGADVINCSWTSISTNQNLLDAIDNAVNYGRSGKGTIVVVSAGNGNANGLRFPAYHSNVLSVGATSMCGERISNTDCDTEEGGASYGSGLDVMAPGGLTPSTDIQGTGGYNPNINLHALSGGSLISNDFSNTDYTTWFNGTSAAAPHVAGIASLVLSINGSLTVQEVRNAIERTAEKIGGYTYTMNSGEQSGLTWNNEMGYGRVNAYRALIYTIENYGVHLGTEMSQVQLPLYDDLTLQQNIELESGSNLIIEPQSNLTIDAGGSVSIGMVPGSSIALQSGGSVTIAKASGTVTIGASSGVFAKAAARDVTQQPGVSPPSDVLLRQSGIIRITRITDGVEVALRLPEDAPVLIEAYDLTGRKVNQPMPTRLMPAGTHAVRLPLRQNHHGIIYLRVKAGNKVYQDIVLPL